MSKISKRGRMIDLKNSGLDLAFDTKTCKLVSKNKNIRLPKADIRTLKQAKKFLMDSASKTANGNEILYYMYRDVHVKEDKPNMDKSNLRYDITIIPPNKIGQEFTKTVGHYHPFLKNEKVTYPEVYEVLSGTAHYLLQKKDVKGNIVEARLVIADKGDKVLIPPNYGHVTINAECETLIMSNVVEMNFSSEYSDFKKKHGAICYCIDVDGRMKFIPNKHYKEHPKMKIIKVKDNPALGLSKNIPLYTSFVKFPNKFRYLTNPQNYFK